MIPEIAAVWSMIEQDQKSLIGVKKGAQTNMPNNTDLIAPEKKITNKLRGLI